MMIKTFNDCSGKIMKDAYGNYLNIGSEIYFSVYGGIEKGKITLIFNEENLVIITYKKWNFKRKSEEIVLANSQQSLIYLLENK